VDVFLKAAQLAATYISRFTKFGPPCVLGFGNQGTIKEGRTFSHRCCSPALFAALAAGWRDPRRTYGPWPLGPVAVIVGAVVLPVWATLTQ
jgi:hypothetical protein